MKKHFKYIIVMCAIILPLTFVYVKADSGWDSDYDSSSSSSSSSSSGSNSYDNDVDSISDLVSIIFFCVIWCFGFIYLPKLSEKKKLYKKITPFDVNVINNQIPSFDKTLFLDNSFQNFVKLQNAWMDFNYDEMKKLVTDELFNTYKSQLKVLGLKKQKNIMKDFELHYNEISEFSRDNDISTIKIIMSVSFYDYIVDSSNKVIRGSDKIKVSNRYELTYIMNNSIQSKTCPCCGAELEINQASICSYCRTKITNYNHEWVLSNKRIKK